MKKQIEEIDVYSIICQSLATTCLIAELDNKKFLKSDFYKEMNFTSDLKTIIDSSGLGNPAMLQMMLYGLLVIPKEKLNIFSNNIFTTLNDKIEKLVEKGAESTYKSDANAIDYLRHIRNAISHCNTKYFNENKVCYVYFYDKNEKTKETCKFTMKTENAGKLLEFLQIELKLSINSYVEKLRKCNS